MNNTPGVNTAPITISVVIPAYNYGRFLRDAINSILAQTVPASEIIVVDDGSTDNTRQVAESFGNQVLYLHQENAGPARARNNGVRAATSDWVAFLDADDQWTPNKLERVREAAQSNPSAGFIYHSFRQIFDNGKREVTTPLSPDRVWPVLRYSNCIGGASSVAVRTDAFLEVGGFDETLWGCEDWDCWFRLAKRHEIILLAEPLSNKLAHADCISSRTEKMLHNDEKLMLKTALSDLTGIQRTIWMGRIQAAILYRAAVGARHSSRLLAGSLLAGSLVSWPSPFFDGKRWVALAYWFLGIKGWGVPASLGLGRVEQRLVQAPQNSGRIPEPVSVPADLHS